MSPEFLLTAFIVCITPGIGVIYTLSVTLGAGWRAGLWATLGCTIATMIHMVIALAGLAAVLHTSAVLFQTIKFAGVAYLIWMAWAVLQSTGSLAVGAATGGSPGQLVWRGILLNILNPKLPLFFVAFLPQFLPASDPALGPMIGLGFGFTAMTFVTFVPLCSHRGLRQTGHSGPPVGAGLDAPRLCGILCRPWCAPRVRAGMTLPINAPAMTGCITFDARIEPMIWSRETCTILRVPADIVAALGPTRRVEGEMNDHPINLALTRAPLCPDVFAWAGQSLLTRIGIAPDDPLEVRLRPAPDDAVYVPDDLRLALRDGDATAAWDGLTPGKQRGLLHPLNTARTAPTRAKGIAALIASLTGAA